MRGKGSMRMKNFGTALFGLLCVLIVEACSGTPPPIKFDAGVKRDTHRFTGDLIAPILDGFATTLVQPVQDGQVDQNLGDSRFNVDREPTLDSGPVDVACTMVSPLTITTASPLLSAQVGKTYQNKVELQGGLPPFHFRLLKTAPELAWLTLDFESGVLTGLSEKVQAPFHFEVQVTDSGQGSCQKTTTKSFEIRVTQCADNAVLECFAAGKDGVCKKGNALCSAGVPGACTNPTAPSTDVLHCGSECQACPTEVADRCVAGLCQCGTGKACGKDQTCCEGKCIHIQTDTENCGGCSKKCLAGLNAEAVCIGGTCASETMCLEGYGHCDPLRPKDCLTRLNTDFNHCGACGNACPENRASSCEQGKCVCGIDKYTCIAPETCCPPGQGLPASCTDLSEGRVISEGLFRCGTCTTTCPDPKGHGSAVCANKRCSTACEAGWEDCGSSGKTKVTPPRDCSVDIDNDVKNCGGCGVNCPRPTSHGSATCENGKCGIECEDGRTPCPGADGAISCVATTSDSANCGACGIRCSKTNASGSACIGSQCIPTCLPGFGDCKRTLNDGCETILNTIAQCGNCTQSCSNAHIAPLCSVVPGEIYHAEVDPCRGGTCAPNYGDCNQNKQIDGCETSLTTTVNCGGCGVACTAQAGQVASCEENLSSQYQCVVRCAPGFFDCDGNESCETSSCDSEDCDENPCNGCAACVPQPLRRR